MPRFGGRFVPEPLVPPLLEATQAWDEDSGQALLAECRAVRRPSPLQPAPGFSTAAGGAQVLLKREDLLEGGAALDTAHGHALLARHLGRKRLIAAGSGVLGIAAALAGRRVGITAEWCVGALDARRSAAAVARARELGAVVHEVNEGTQTLKEAVGEALRRCLASPEDAYLLPGAAIGPEPCPALGASFSEGIGTEIARQSLEDLGRPPDAIVADASEAAAVGALRPFLQGMTRLVVAEAAEAAPLTSGTEGTLHGARTLLLQDAEGQLLDPHSNAPGLDYPAAAPELAEWRSSGRLEVMAVTDAEAMDALRTLEATEGIRVSAEAAHGVAAARAVARDLGPDAFVVVVISGGGAS